MKPDSQDGPRSILLVDPCPVVERGLRQLIHESSFTIEERVGNLPDARRCLTSRVIDIVLAEYIFGEGTIDDLWRICRREQTPLLLFSAWENPGFEARVIRLGVCGLISKRAEGPVICATLERATAGESTWSRQEIRRANGSMVAGSLSRKIEFPLTERELQVLRSVAQGNANRTIADQLDIGFETVKEHVQHVLVKMNVNDRTQAAVMARRHGLL